jgi:hypothetical protein
MHLKAVLVALCIAASLIAAGCGSSSGGGTGSAGGSTAARGNGEEGGKASSEGATGTEGATGASGGGASKSGPLTKKAFSKRAEAICEKIPTVYKNLKNALERKLKRTLSLEEETLRTAVPPIYAAVDELEQLGTPNGDAQRINALIAALEEAAKGLEAEPKSKLAGPGSPYAKFQALAKAYGLKYCSLL